MSTRDDFGWIESIDAESVVTARSDVSSVELDGEIVLYDDGLRRFHRLNPTAATVWQCLDGSVALRDIAIDIAEIYDLEVATLLPQVVALTRSLAREGLLWGPEGASVESPGAGVGH